VAEDSSSVRVFLEMVNVGRRPQLEDWSVETTMLERDVPIMRRGSHVSRVSEVEQTLSPPCLVRCLEHLMACYLLHVGDHGTHNMLRTAAGTVVGIDLEETRTSSKATAATHPLDVLFKKSSEAQRQLCGPLLQTLRCREQPFTAEDMAVLTSVGLDAVLVEERRALFAAMMSRTRALAAKTA
jgi:hypothetical protein